MYDIGEYYFEEVASLGIAIVLGLLFLLAPQTVYRYVIYLYRGADTGSGGQWGSDPSPGHRAILAIRGIGVLFLLIALAFAFAPWWRGAFF